MTDTNTAIKVENRVNAIARLKDEMHDSIVQSPFSFIKSPIKITEALLAYKFDDTEIDSDSPDIVH
jgi:hypothetical protein